MGKAKKASKTAYKRTLWAIYKGISDEKKKKAEELIGRLADVLLMMDECREHLEEEGLVTEMQQGDYSIERENPYSKIYDAKHKLMLLTVDRLDKMLPINEGAGKDALMKYLEGEGQ